MTCRLWQLGLRARYAAAVALVGEATARRFRQYLASSELQFHRRDQLSLRAASSSVAPLVATTRGVCRSH